MVLNLQIYIWFVLYFQQCHYECKLKKRNLKEHNKFMLTIMHFSSQNTMSQVPSLTGILLMYA